MNTIWNYKNKKLTDNKIKYIFIFLDLTMIKLYFVNIYYNLFWKFRSLLCILNDTWYCILLNAITIDEKIMIFNFITIKIKFF